MLIILNIYKILHAYLQNIVYRQNIVNLNYDMMYVLHKMDENI